MIIYSGSNKERERERDEVGDESERRRRCFAFRSFSLKYFHICDQSSWIKEEDF